MPYHRRAMQAEIKALDKAVAEATEQRKSDHAAFVQAQAENQAATQLIEVAKNKLNKPARLHSRELPREKVCRGLQGCKTN